MSVERLKAETSSSNFVKWQVYYEEKDKREMNNHDSTVWHLAQLTAEVACLPFRVFGHDPPEKLRDTETYLLKFTTREEFERNKKKADRERREMDKQNSINILNMWLGVGQPDQDGKPKVRSIPLHMLPKQPGTPADPANSSQNGPSPPVFSPEGVPTPPAPQNKKTGRSRSNRTVRGKTE